MNGQRYLVHPKSPNAGSVAGAKTRGAPDLTRPGCPRWHLARPLLHAPPPEALHLALDEVRPRPRGRTAAKASMGNPQRDPLANDARALITLNFSTSPPSRCGIEQLRPSRRHSRAVRTLRGVRPGRGDRTATCPPGLASKRAGDRLPMTVQDLASARAIFAALMRVVGHVRHPAGDLLHPPHGAVRDLEHANLHELVRHHVLGQRRADRLLLGKHSRRPPSTKSSSMTQCLYGSHITGQLSSKPYLSGMVAMAVPGRGRGDAVHHGARVPHLVLKPDNKLVGADRAQARAHQLLGGGGHSPLAHVAVVRQVIAAHERGGRRPRWNRAAAAAQMIPNVDGFSMSSGYGVSQSISPFNARSMNLKSPELRGTL